MRTKTIKKIARAAVAAFAVAALTACATQTLRAGPVVTGISAGGDGTLIVEKCVVELTEHLDYWAGSSASSAAITDCNSYTLTVVSEK